MIKSSFDSSTIKSYCGWTVFRLSRGSPEASTANGFDSPTHIKKKCGGARTETCITPLCVRLLLCLRPRWHQAASQDMPLAGATGRPLRRHHLSRMRGSRCYKEHATNRSATDSTHDMSELMRLTKMKALDMSSQS